MGKVSSEEVYVPFSNNFRNSISINPIVTITALNTLSKITITRQTKNGFYVKAESGVESITFNWIAMAK